MESTAQQAKERQYKMPDVANMHAATPHSQQEQTNALLARTTVAD
jgi:hypothetical protein